MTDLAAVLPPLSTLLVGAAMVFGAGVLRGFTGYGFAVAAVPLLSLIVRPAVAVPIVLVLQVLVSANGMGGAVRHCDWRSVRLLAAGAVVATPLGVLALTSLPDSAVRLAIAGIVTAAVVVLGRGVTLVRPPGRGWVILFGALAGLFNGVAGMPGPPIIAYYLASPLDSAAARASMIVLFLLTAAAALVPLALAGAVSLGTLALGAAALPAVWAGSWLGAWLFAHSSEVAYRWAGLCVLGSTALLTATKAIAAMS